MNSADDLGYLELKHVEHPTRAYAIAPVVRGIAVPVLQRRVALPSIAVLPLQNLSGDPSDDYFGDGIVEDITVSLASLRELLVISRATTLKYRGQQPDPRAVGVELGVRYVLMGTVRRSQRMMRVSVQLCDTESGASIWGDKEQISPDDLFEMQDNVVTRIVAGIAPYVRQTQLQAALRKRPDSFTAYDYTLRALDLIKGLNRTRFMQAREYLRRAMAEDPNFAMPAAWAARWHSRYVGQGWSQNKSRDSSEAIALAAKAIELDGQNSLALATYGHLKSYLLHDYDAAVACFARALSSCPSNALAWMLSSNTFAYLGDGDEALQRAEHALHLSPFDSGIGFYYSTLAIAHYVRGSFTEAAKWSRMSVNENPAYTSNLRYLTAILVGLGDLGEAREIAAELLRREPDFRLSEWQQRQPIHDPDISVKHIERLALAGLPW